MKFFIKQQTFAVYRVVILLNKSKAAGKTFVVYIKIAKVFSLESIVVYGMNLAIPWIIFYGILKESIELRIAI